MICERVLGKYPIDLSVDESFQNYKGTRLQNAVVDYMLSGGRFNTTGMFVLREEVDIVGRQPYRKEKWQNEFVDMVDCKKATSIIR